MGLRATALAAMVGLIAGLGAGRADADARGAKGIQHVYERGVPHVDRNGRPMERYEAGRSFFPIGVWGVVLPDAAGGPYFGWEEFAKVGFNTVWPFNWDARALGLAKAAGLQVVYMGGMSEAEAKRIGGDPNLLGNMWKDEPSGQPNVAELYGQFVEYRKKIRAASPGLPVFINDTAFVRPPLLEWWRKWNQTGDIACQDIYPLMDRTGRARSLVGDPHDLPGVTRLAAEVTGERKPVWVVVAAFDSPGQSDWPFRFPTVKQLRAEVYAAVIHGATGVAYFTMDCQLARQGGVVGMSPKPKADYGAARVVATPEQLITSRALWEMAGQINGELKELTPVLLSPTVGADYRYDVDVKGEAVTETPIRAMLKPHPAGGYVLMVVNVDDAVLDVTFTFPEKLKSAAVMFENGGAMGLDQLGTKFHERFEPFDTHVYRVIPAGSAGR